MTHEVLRVSNSPYREPVYCRCPLGRTEPGVVEKVHGWDCPNRPIGYPYLSERPTAIPRSQGGTPPRRHR
jgi:hypothetical protein